VNPNYTQANSDVLYAFGRTGDFAYPTFLPDLEMLLNNSVRVALYYGDADYICNWFGGEAISLRTAYTHSADFRTAGYAPFMVDGVEYGEVRQYGNFSFMRIYESGHKVPFYQPAASLEMFKRVLGNKDIATGNEDVTGTYGSKGEAHATHTESFVAIPTPAGSYTAATTDPIISVAAVDEKRFPTSSAIACGRFVDMGLGSDLA